MEQNVMENIPYTATVTLDITESLEYSDQFRYARIVLRDIGLLSDIMSWEQMIFVFPDIVHIIAEVLAYLFQRGFGLVCFFVFFTHPGFSNSSAICQITICHLLPPLSLAIATITITTTAITTWGKSFFTPLYY